MENLTSRLAVCSWSLQPTTPAELFERLAQTGIARLQCALDPLRDAPAVWGDFDQQCRDRGVKLASGMFGCLGEDYTTMESIRVTGGIVPDHTWETNWKHAPLNADLAARLGLKLVTFHAGFMPHEESDPEYAKLMKRLQMMADVFAARGLALAFETGQETADTLAEFLGRLDRANVGVNFDPANMILYDKGDPIQALRRLGPWIRQCHIKDAKKTKQPGTWGEEVTVGTGEVDWRAFFQVLAELKFTGDLCIEREAGTQRVADIRAARTFLESLNP
jgi:L-ribulose-5-phosphate 3-epimerase